MGVPHLEARTGAKLRTVVVFRTPSNLTHPEWVIVEPMIPPVHLRILSVMGTDDENFVP
jgi:hypothetical protein